MEWFIGLLLLVIGAVLGFLGAKVLSKQDPRVAQKSDSQQTLKALMAQQAVEHLQDTKLIAQQLMAHSEALNQQVSDYEQLLINQKSDGEQTSLNYFGEHASTYLRNKSSDPTRTKSNTSVQPLDFSSEASGLFSGEKETEVKKPK
jgi:uncharacterized membrane-anchored protein YhcB (DUF1043 family)